VQNLKNGVAETVQPEILDVLRCDETRLGMGLSDICEEIRFRLDQTILNDKECREILERTKKLQSDE
jgi:hypothetical protein